MSSLVCLPNCVNDTMRIIDIDGLLSKSSVEIVRAITKVSLQIAKHDNNRKVKPFRLPSWRLHEVCDIS